MKSLFWMKQIQGSVRVKINEYVHSWAEFLCVSLRFFSFSIYFPKLIIFTILSLYMACKMWKLLPSLERLVEKFHISAFHVLFSILLDCGAWNYKTKKKVFARNPEKRTQKQAQKDMNKMEWHKMNYLISSAMRKRKRHIFCTSSHHNVPHEKQQRLNRGSEPWNKCPCKSACAIVKYAPRYYTPERTTWRKYLGDCYNCRQYCFGLISAVLMLRWRWSFKKPPRASHKCGNSVLPECSNESTLVSVRNC